MVDPETSSGKQGVKHYETLATVHTHLLYIHCYIHMAKLAHPVDFER